MTFEQYAENLLEDFNTRILDENGEGVGNGKSCRQLF